jgi:hypothetical protein
MPKGQKVAHIIKGVIDLRFAQRAMPPFGQRFPLESWMPSS